MAQPTTPIAQTTVRPDAAEPFRRLRRVVLARENGVPFQLTQDPHRQEIHAMQPDGFSSTDTGSATELKAAFVRMQKQLQATSTTQRLSLLNRFSMAIAATHLGAAQLTGINLKDLATQTKILGWNELCYAIDRTIEIDPDILTEQKPTLRDKLRNGAFRHFASLPKTDTLQPLQEEARHWAAFQWQPISATLKALDRTKPKTPPTGTQAA